ncbi:hypothetical protein D932_03315 [Enterococcus casseliflavus 14-MB-W-14]|nr:hypothetical protein D932_03315 [Enterococcus casseliflavus 14-MB-W-14]
MYHISSAETMREKNQFLQKKNAFVSLLPRIIDVDHRLGIT